MSSLLKLNGTRQLQKEGFSLPTLYVMEHRAILSAHKSLLLTGTTNQLTSEDILQQANELLPRGPSLYQAYVQTKADEKKFPLQDLETLSDTLEKATGNLEIITAKAMAQGSKAQESMARFAKTTGQIAQQYAELISAGRELESMGLITMGQQRLTKITERPEGPLRVVYDKAIAILQSGPKHEAPKMRTA